MFLSVYFSFAHKYLLSVYYAQRFGECSQESRQPGPCPDLYSILGLQTFIKPLLFTRYQLDTSFNYVIYF